MRFALRFPTLEHARRAFEAMGGVCTAATLPRMKQLLLELLTEVLHFAAARLFTVVAQRGPFGPRNPAMGLWLAEMLYKLNDRELVIRDSKAFDELLERASTVGLTSEEMERQTRPLQ